MNVVKVQRHTSIIQCKLDV